MGSCSPHRRLFLSDLRRAKQLGGFLLVSRENCTKRLAPKGLYPFPDFPTTHDSFCVCHGLFNRVVAMSMGSFPNLLAHAQVFVRA